MDVQSEKMEEIDLNSEECQWLFEYQELFEYMSNEHGVILLQSELQDIVRIVKRIDTTDFGFEVGYDFEDKEIDDNIKQEMLAKKSGMTDEQILNGEHFDIEF